MADRSIRIKVAESWTDGIPVNTSTDSADQPDQGSVSGWGMFHPVLME